MHFRSRYQLKWQRGDFIGHTLAGWSMSCSSSSHSSDSTIQVRHVVCENRCGCRALFFCCCCWASTGGCSYRTFSSALAQCKFWALLRKCLCRPFSFSSLRVLSIAPRLASRLLMSPNSSPLSVLLQRQRKPSRTVCDKTILPFCVQ